jgi:hypothetical protein
MDACPVGSCGRGMTTAWPTDIIFHLNMNVSIFDDSPAANLIH